MTITFINYAPRVVKLCSGYFIMQATGGSFVTGLDSQDHFYVVMVAKASKAGVFVCSAKWLMVLPKKIC